MARRRHVIMLASMALLIAGTEQGMQAAEKDITARNKEAIQEGFKAWRNGTGGVFDLLAPDARWTIVGNAPVSRTYTSRQEFLDVVINPFNARLSSRLVPSVRGIYADGDMVIALFDGVGTARDGKPYKNTYSWYMRMREGRIVEVVAFFDTLEFTDFWTRIKPN
ncbi:MAG TPA: nuclear transport factor 2 family protein [Bryobacteraceae bacterium]|nr:nuclear transport factor 2 family protein [Bryobacteraceae bacterium]